MYYTVLSDMYYTVLYDMLLYVVFIIGQDPGSRLDAAALAELRPCGGRGGIDRQTDIQIDRHMSYRCRINKRSSRCRLRFESSGPAPRISKLTQRYPAAAHRNECLFIRPIALTFAMSVNIDIRGEGVRPTLATSRMSVYLSDTGIG